MSSSPAASSSKTFAGRENHGKDDLMEIPSTGVEFFEYRRRLFLASLPPPEPLPNAPFPSSYKVPSQIPEPVSYSPIPPPPTSSLGKLEALLVEPGAEEGEKAWNAGVGNVHKNLEGGKRLAKGLRLGLVIKILRAGWLRDGTWPIDPKTRKAAVPPPDSPTSTAPSLSSSAFSTRSPPSAAARRDAKYAHPFRSPPT